MKRRRWVGGATLGATLAWLHGMSSGAAAGPATTDPQACRLLPNAPAPLAPADAVNVRRHGVHGDGQRPDGQALQQLFDRASPGQTLWFPPGVYVQDRALTLGRTDLTLLGHGATLHATNPASQALIVQGDRCRVLGFTMTALTDSRRMAPWESRIAVWRQDSQVPVDGVQICQNHILPSGPPCTPGANSSSSAAIYLERATRFLVAGNVVQRSLADGIHVTGGSRDGVIAGNQVRDTGDDMIAVVSYLAADAALPLPPAPALLAQWQQRRRAFLVRNILITGNDLTGAYWGRGISVVGGEDVSIIDNTLDRCTHAAAVYLAREPGWRTFGVRNVRVAGNRITRVQTLPPAYSVLPEPARSARTGHGGIELVAHRQESEAEPALLAQLGIERVLLEHNQVQQCKGAGIRLGDGWGLWVDAPAPAGFSGSRSLRWTGAPVRQVALRHNQVADTDGGIEVHNVADTHAALLHEGNRVDGTAWLPQAGQPLPQRVPLATGSSLRCPRAWPQPGAGPALAVRPG